MKLKKMLSSLVLLAAVGGLALSACAKNNETKKDADGKKVPVVGVLQFVSHPALDTIYKGVQAGLKESGYEDGKTVTIKFQNGQADQSKLSTMSQQLVSDKSDVLIGIATPSAQALAEATSDIPIVMGAVSDPVYAKLVKSIEKPGGNITGVSDKSPVGKQMELVKKILPDSKKMGILYCSAEDNSAAQAKDIQAIAEKNGYKVEVFAIPSAENITQTVQTMSKKVDFIYIPTDNTIANAMDTVADAADGVKIPVIPSVDTMVEQGGLATVGINQYELGVQTGKMAAAILNGESKPESTPVYVFTDGDTIINTAQAKKLGITIPADVLEGATIVGDEK